MSQPHQGWTVGLVSSNAGSEPLRSHTTYPGQYYIVEPPGALAHIQAAPPCDGGAAAAPPKSTPSETPAAVPSEHCTAAGSGTGSTPVASPAPLAPGGGVPGDGTTAGDGTAEATDEDDAIDIVISNVVCCFSTRCHLNLKRIAQEGMNVIYRRECGMVSMKLRNPYTTASIWSSGKITCTGATSEVASHTAARRYARLLQNLGFRTRFANFRVVNVLGTCSLPFGIRINSFSREHKQQSSYEPELHPGVTYRIKSPKATLKIFSTGSITVTAPSVQNIQSAIEHIFPLVSGFKMAKREQNTTGYLQMMPRPRPATTTRTTMVAMGSDDDDDESFDSDASHD